MAGATLEERVAMLERHVSELATRDDVRAVADQILHLGTEMRAGFSAIREEIRAGDEESRNFMRVLYEDAIDRLGKLSG